MIHTPLSLEFNNEIKKLKKTYYYNNKDFSSLNSLPSQITASWNNSRKNGIDPFSNFTDIAYEKVEMDKISDESKILLKAATPLIEKIVSHLFPINGLCLADKNGLVLLVKEAARSPIKKNAFSEGIVLSEENIGTISQNLCIKYQKPVQLFGAANYHSFLEDDLSMSTPIFNTNNELIGALTLNIVTKEEIEDAYLERTYTYLMGWAKSLAHAIQSQVMLINKNQSFTITNEAFETVISAVDKGILAIDCNGNIKHVNKESERILGDSKESIIKNNISEYIDNTRILDRIINQKKTIESMENIKGKNKPKLKYFIKISPILDQNQNVEGAVLTIPLVSENSTTINKQTGNTAIYDFEKIIGNSDSLTKTINIAKKFAYTNNNVLIVGESGTGKELFAQSIHNQSRARRPFIAINCASVSHSLIESELFGYEGGTFTGADKKGRKGKIELANGGTLFLDEIGDMPLEIQPILLRVLEDKKIMRLGGNRYIPVDFRLVTATNKDLLQAVRDKEFREDLYYRIATFKVIIPPLRKREGDIELLAKYFIEEACQEMERSIPVLSKETLDYLNNHYWSGNVRQLQNVIIYAVSMLNPAETLIGINHLPSDMFLNNNTPHEDFNNISSVTTLRDLEKEAIENALAICDFNVEDAAIQLGISRATLYRRIKEYNIVLKK